MTRIQRITLQDADKNRTGKECNKGPGQGTFSGREGADWGPQRRSWDNKDTGSPGRVYQHVKKTLRNHCEGLLSFQNTALLYLT